MPYPKASWTEIDKKALYLLFLDLSLSLSTCLNMTKGIDNRHAIHKLKLIDRRLSPFHLPKKKNKNKPIHSTHTISKSIMDTNRHQ